MPTFSAMLLVIVSGFTLMSCNSNRTDKAYENKSDNMPFDKNAAQSFVDSMNTKFSAKLAAGDSASLASHYWPEAELLLDNSEAVKGSNILNAWGGAIRMGIKELALSTTDIAGNSNFIIETGGYEMKDASKNVLDKGKYVVVWEKRNGEWKIYRDIGSTSMPAKK